MNLKMKALMSAVVVGLPLAAALHVNDMAARATEAGIAGGAAKDQARLESSEVDTSGLLTELAQAARPPAMRLAQAFAPGRPPQAPGADARFEPPPPPMMGPPPPPPLTRAACENNVDREAGLAGYLSSKLRLTTEQMPLWRKVEDAAQPAVAELHAACDRLPVDPVAGAPNLPDVLDALEAQTSARLDLIRATKAPLRALYQTLTPVQRAALRPPLPPLRHP